MPALAPSRAAPACPAPDDAVEQVLLRALAGSAEALPAEAEEQAWQRIEFHGIAYALAAKAGARPGWPPLLAARIAEEARQQAFWEVSHREVIGLVLTDLAAAGVPSVLMKGTALAYTVYADPAMRRRGDTDLLVPFAGLDRARSVLQAQGFDCLVIRGVVAQEQWTRQARGGFFHTIDLHWQVADPPAMQRVLSPEEVLAEAVPCPRLAPGARAAAPEHQLLLCAMNQAWHRRHGYFLGDRQVFGGERLVWAMDIDRLCRGWSDATWDRAAVLAGARGVPHACLAALDFAARTFATPVPARIRAFLAAEPQGSDVERYLSSTSRHEQFLINLRATRRQRDRLRLLASNLFPPREEMAGEAGGTGFLALVRAYAARLARIGLAALRRG